MSPATIRVESEGVEETIRAFRGLEKDLRKEASAELRVAAKVAAAELADRLRAAASSSATPVAARVAAAVTVKSDRFPTVQIGGSKAVGRYGAPAAELVWGSEQGGENFGAAAGGSYWIGPTVRAYGNAGAVVAFRRALYEITRRYGLD